MRIITEGKICGTKSMAECVKTKRAKTNISEVIWPHGTRLFHVLHHYKSSSVIMWNETLFTLIVLSLNINVVHFVEVQCICISRHTTILTKKILLADGVQQRPLLFQCEMLQMFWAFSPDRDVFSIVCDQAITKRMKIEVSVHIKIFL